MKKLEWLFRLTDRVSGPANRMRSALDGVTGALARVRTRGVAGNLDRLTASLDASPVLGAVSAWDRFADKISPVTRIAGAVASGVAAIGGAAIAAGAAIAGMSLYVGRSIVEMAAFRESTLSTLSVLSGGGAQGDAAARRMFGQATRLAAATPFSMEQVVTAFTSLRTAGFGEGQLSPLVAAASDLAAGRGNDPEVLASAVRAFGKIQAKGRVSMEELMQLAEGTGLSLQQFYAAVGRGRGLTGPNASRQVAQLISQGKIGSGEALVGIGRAVSAQFGGGPLGTLTERQSQTLTGLLSTAKDIIPSIVQSIDLANAPGLMAFRGFLQNVIGLMDAGSERGRRLAEIVSRFANGLFTSVFGDLATGQGAADVLDRVLGAVDGIASGLVSAVRAMMDFGKGFGSQVLTDLREMRQIVPGLSGDWRGMGENVGRVATGVLQLAGAIGWLVDKFITFGRVLGELPAGAVAAILGFSPTDVARADAAIGSRAETRGIAPAVPVVGAGATTTAPQVTQNIHVNVESRGDPESDGHAMGQAVAAAMRTQAGG